jgi:hypothetical protein
MEINLEDCGIKVSKLKEDILTEHKLSYKNNHFMIGEI